MADDDEKKVEITLLTDVKVDVKLVGKRGETHLFGAGTAAMLVNNGLAVQGKVKIDVAAEPTKSKS